MEFSAYFFTKTPVFLLFFLALTEILSSEVPRPRGVPLSRASLYTPGEHFACFDHSKTIPFGQVNDDYCDCPDASDEPGTSACPHGRFYCTNAGHKPLNIASNRVNDGICDCCDGTDEYSGGRCPNICLQLGKSAREEAQKQSELIRAGKELKSDMSQRGIKLKQVKKEKIVELSKNKEEAVKVKEERQKIKDEAEAIENQALEYYRKLEEEEKQRRAEEEAVKTRQEASETFILFDSNQNGLVEIVEIQTRQSFDKDKNGEVSIEEARYFLNNEDSLDLEKFITDAWPNIKPFLMLDSGMFKPPRVEKPADESDDLNQEIDDETNPEDQEENADEEENEEEEEEEEPPYEPKEDHQPKQLTYDEETQKIVDQATSARNDYSEAERSVRDIEGEIKSIEEYLTKDFGPEEEFAVLEGECFDYQDHEYVYRLCPFEKTTQTQKSGSGETRLGQWGKWDGDSSNNNKFDYMLYDRGQSCWNGPQRSTRVKVTCGVENKLVSVSEPNRCEYLFEFVTPAACREVVRDFEDEDLHDEL